ncbi:hypothetical protein [uncultured Algibacter sp.]|uniref:hypothetical protein n=1 Tax=uncultured Algibacter sp. TaxID=298659 RepID=UPI002614CAB1|nr:hypothetical protein [uncultured Algibacter sp.]
MTKSKLKLFLLFLVLSSTSCKKDIETILEADYKVVEVDYGFDNYMKNMRDKSEDFIIKERNIVIIDVDKNGRTTIKGHFVEDSLIVDELLKYIVPSPENDEMPITIEEDYQYSGKVIVNKNLILLARFNESLDYKTYSGIRNKIYSAYNAARDKHLQERFGITLKELINSSEKVDILKWNELKQIIPMSYNEIAN